MINEKANYPLNGDMKRSTYDTDADGIVDNAEKVNNHTVGCDVPADAVFTDTVYTHPTYTARTGKPTANQTPGFGDTFTVSQVKSDATGHVSEMNDRTVKIPNATATPSTSGSGGTAGLMSASDKEKLNGIASGATANSASTSNPAMDGTASAGSSDAYARGDHVHPTDITRAPLASPEFTGTPKAPTAALNTDTTQIASTAFVHQEMANGAKANSSRHLGFYIDQDGDLCQA